MVIVIGCIFPRVKGKIVKTKVGPDLSRLLSSFCYMHFALLLLLLLLLVLFQILLSLLLL